MDLKGSNKWFDTEAVYSGAGIDHLSGFRLVAKSSPQRKSYASTVRDRMALFITNLCTLLNPVMGNETI